MKRLLAALTAAGLAAAIAIVPVAATTTRTSLDCIETRATEWTGGTEWVDENFVYHVRGSSATYVGSGGSGCAWTNHATVSLNLDLITGEGMVTADAHIVLAGGAGGYDGLLVAQFTPAGPNIWEGRVIGHGFGSMAGAKLLVSIVEPDHEHTSLTGYSFFPGE